ncbi:MAG: AI-2E family transporter [Cytophagales bacterium]|nr:AI-2E family transporter [Cytophagales bacterium]
MNLTRTASVLVLAIAIVFILITGQDLLIPFVFAVLIWFLVRKVKSALDKVPFFKDRFPNWLKTIVTSAALLFMVVSIGRVLSASINSLAQSYGQYESNVNLMIAKINEIFSIDMSRILSDFMVDFDFGSTLESILSSITALFGNAFMILIYVLFVFLEEASFQTKLRAVFTEKNKYDQWNKILNKIEGSITHYIGLKTMTSTITGVLSYGVLLAIGVDSPIFWAFLIFILNYIPAVGSMVATLFPAIFSLLQFGEFQPFFMVLIFVGLIQVLVGNVLEPKLMGNSLNISALVTILSLSFWGSVWGIIGMFLSVPITVILVIVWAQFPSTRPIAIMLSDKGQV